MPRRAHQQTNIPRIPTIRSRDKDLAGLLNTMGRAINALASPKITVASGRRPVAGASYPDLFEPLSITASSSGSVAILRMQTPNVREIVPTTGVDAIVVHDVYYNSAIVTTGTEIPVPSGSWVMCKVYQTSLGAVSTTSVPEIVIDTELTASDHWYPPDPGDTAGAEGTMYYPLYQISLTASVPSIDLWHVGPIEITQDLWHGISATTGAKVYYQQDEAGRAAYKFRSITGIAPILATENGDTIDVEIDGGWWGTVNWTFYDYVYESSSSITLTFEGGILVDVDASGSNAYANNAGTEGDPGVAGINTYAYAPT